MTNQSGEWRDGFLFLANDLALDFLNTRPVIDGEAVELLTDFPTLLRWFEAAGVLDPQQTRRLKESSAQKGVRVLQEMRQFRERFREEITAWEQSGKLSDRFLGELNENLARYPMLLRLVHHGQGLEEYVDAQAPQDLFAPVVAAAARLLTAADHSRVRQCDACVLHFRDVSKKGTRRWCSMQLCGNREKVAAYASRQRHAMHEKRRLARRRSV